MTLQDHNLRLAAACLLLFSAIAARAQQNARDLVRKVVKSEIAADNSDKSRWMFRDANKTPARSTVKLVVQTADGDLSKLIELNGHPPTAEQQKADQQKMHRFATDASVRQKQRQADKQDNQKATGLTQMLPDAFLWSITGQTADETILAFKPDPKFNPPNYQARVFAAMQGTMVVDTKEDRIKSLKGKLTREVDFGYGFLGKLQQGGTFNIERQRLAPGIWDITQTHVHIQGHALFFKSIGDQEDEVTSDYKPSPPGLTLPEAEKMLDDGEAAKALGAPSAALVR